jgi:hypothetical protein
MDNIPPTKGACKTAAYFDTLGLFIPDWLSRYQWLSIRRQLRAVHSNKRTFTYFKPSKSGYGWRLQLSHAPSLPAIQLLAEIQRHYRAKLCRFDLAADLLASIKRDAERIKDTLLHTMVLRRAHGRANKTIKETVYLVPWKARGRNCRIYADRHSKLVDAPCCHVELMFLDTQTVKRAGFTSIEQLMLIDPAAMFDRHLKLISDVPGRWTYAHNYYKAHSRKQFTSIPMSIMGIPRMITTQPLHSYHSTTCN